MFVKVNSNVDKAVSSWGEDMPSWVRLLAGAADATNQKAAGERIGRSGGLVSRVISRTYTGSYEEVATRVRAIFGEEDVLCPIWGEAVPLTACIRARRRQGPARTSAHRTHDAHCPGCPNNTDDGGHS